MCALQATTAGRTDVVFTHPLCICERIRVLCQKITLPFPNSGLNLFAYTGETALATAKTGANVTHVDASKGMVA